MESLMQRMDNITEELKVKDILLARAEEASKQPQDNHPSPNSGYPSPRHISPRHPNTPPPLMDDDVYMNDTEAIKLRGETRFKGFQKGNIQQNANSDTKSESYKRGMRKARRVQENELDEDVSDSDNEMEWRATRKRKVQYVEEDMDGDDERELTVTREKKGKGKAQYIEDGEQDEGSDNETRNPGYVEEDEEMRNSDTNGLRERSQHENEEIDEIPNDWDIDFKKDNEDNIATAVSPLFYI